MYFYKHVSGFCTGNHWTCYFSHFVCLFVFFWTLRYLYNFTTSFPAASVCPTSLLPSLPDLTHSFLYLTMIGNG